MSLACFFNVILTSKKTQVRKKYGNVEGKYIRCLGENTLLGTEENRKLKPEVEFENVNSIAYLPNEKKKPFDTRYNHYLCDNLSQTGNVSKLLKNKRAW